MTLPRRYRTQLVLSRVDRFPIYPVGSHPVARYSCALAITAAATLLGIVVNGIGANRFPFLLLYPAVILTSLLAGLGAGIVTLFLSCLAATYLWLAPTYTFYVENPADQFKLLLFVLGNVITLITAESLHRAKIRLEESQGEASALAERLRLSLNVAPLYLYTTDRDLRFTFLAKPFPGFTVGQMLGKREEDLFPPAMVAPITAFKRQVLETRKASRAEITLESEGSSYHWDVSAEPLYNDAGEVIGLNVAALDITERRQQQAELAASESRFHEFMDSLPNLAWVTDQGGKLLWFNQRWWEYTGASERPPHYNGNAPVHPDDLERVTSDWQKAFAAGTFWECTFRLRRHDGVYRSHLSRAVPLRNAEGEITLWVGTNTDVEQQLEAERNIASLNRDLQRRIDEFDTLLKVIPIGIGIALDRECKNIRLNPAFARMLGLEIDALGTPLSPQEKNIPRYRILQDGRELTPEQLPLRVAARDGVEIKDVILDITRDGANRVRLLEYATPLVDEHGTPRGAVGAFVDLSERMAAEERFRLMADSAPVLVWLADTTKARTWFNRVWLEFAGRTMEQEWGNGWTEDVHPEDRDRCLQTYNAAFDARQPFSMEYRLRHHTGEYRWLLSQGRPLHEGPGGDFSGFIGSCIDITVMKLLEKERLAVLESERAARQVAEHARTEAEQLSRMKDEFLATLSHELRTPLNAVLGWLEILRRGSPSPDDITEGLEVLERNARMQAQLIEDLLDMSRIVSGKLHLETHPADLGGIIEAAITTVFPAAQARRVRIERELAPDVTITADASRLQQVIWNLLSNAVKFTPAGGLVTVTLTTDREHAIVRVSDTGQGISGDFLPHVFDRFRQADGSTTRRQGGLGIGLSIVKQLTELHGGTVHVHSDGKDLGSTFTLLFPLHANAPSSRPGRQRPDNTDLRRHGAASLAGLTIAIVEDDADARSLIYRFLSQAGADVLPFDGVDAALERLDADRVDLIVSDIGMPRRDGYELIRVLRARPDHPNHTTPAIALTAFARAEDERRALAAGYNAHLPKPLDPALLISTLTDLASQSSPPPR